MTNRTARVLLVDDHPIIREGVRSLLERDPAIAIVGEAENGRDGLRLALELSPDIVVLDMSLPELSGIAVAKRLAELRAPCKVIALTAHEEAGYLHELMRLGMGGYVLKRSATADLARAIAAVMAGGVYLDPAIAGSVLSSSAPPLAPSAAAVELSEREIAVLRLIAQGHPTKTIATRLRIGERTVETYRTRAMDKLGLQSRAEIVRYAADRGWLGSS